MCIAMVSTSSPSTARARSRGAPVARALGVRATFETAARHAVMRLQLAWRPAESLLHQQGGEVASPGE